MYNVAHTVVRKSPDMPIFPILNYNISRKFLHSTLKNLFVTYVDGNMWRVLTYPMYRNICIAVYIYRVRDQVISDLSNSFHQICQFFPILNYNNTFHVSFFPPLFQVFSWRTWICDVLTYRAYCKICGICLSSQRSSDSDLLNSFWTIHTTVSSLWSNIYIYIYIYIWSMYQYHTSEHRFEKIYKIFSYSTKLYMS